MMVSGAMMCDTEDELLTLLTEMHLAHGYASEEKMPASCGQFSPENPVPVMATPLYWYETPSVQSLVTHFVHPGTGWTQYGWSGFVVNQEYLEALAEQDT